MKRILEAFANPAFIPFIVAGDPDPATSFRIADALCDAGAPLIEIGIPFSDPAGDGDEVRMADERALAAGATPDTAFALARHIRGRSTAAVIFLTYANIVWRRGIGRFFEDLKEAGADGLVIADLPFEEAKAFVRAARATETALIHLISPATGDVRMRKIASSAEGFLYLIARRGVTGTADTVSDDLPGYIRRVRLHTSLPLAVGFGISRPEHVRNVIAAGADGAICGSAIAALIREKPSMAAVETEKFVSAMVLASREEGA